MELHIHGLGDTADSLKWAAEGENEEWTEMYARMAKEAEDAYIGAAGIENSLEDQLTQYIEYRQGSRDVEINTRGKVVRELNYTAPTDGNSVVLTIDLDLEKVMSKDCVYQMRNWQIIKRLLNPKNWLHCLAVMTII